MTTYRKIGPLNVFSLVHKNILILDDTLEIGDLNDDIFTKYEGSTDYEGQVDDNNEYHGIGKWITYQVMSNKKVTGT